MILSIYYLYANFKNENMNSDIKLVFTGSRVEGLFLKDLLYENNIGSIVKDVFQSSVQAGWADGLPEDTIRIFVEDEYFDEAKSILEEYFTNRDKKQD